MPVDNGRLVRFEAIYGEAYSRLTAYAARRCDSPQDAADAVTATFALAWQRLEELPSGSEATLRLYGVARDVLADRRRTENRHQSRSADLDAAMTGLYTDSPEHGEALEAIVQIFRALPEADRELLSLVAWEGLDRQEVATTLGLTRHRVRVKIRRARRRFIRAASRGGHPFPGGEAAAKNADKIDATVRAAARVEPGKPVGDPSGMAARMLLIAITSQEPQTGTAPKTRRYTPRQLAVGTAFTLVLTAGAAVVPLL